MLSRYIRSINDLLARTSHQRTTSKKRTKPLLPKCPLFGGSTVHSVCVFVHTQARCRLCVEHCVYRCCIVPAFSELCVGRFNSVVVCLV